MKKILLWAPAVLSLALLAAGCSGKEKSAAPTEPPAASAASSSPEEDWEATAQVPVTGQLAEGESGEGSFWEDGDTVPAAEDFWGGEDTVPAQEDFWAGSAAAPAPADGDLVTLPDGGHAPAADFVFPASGSEALSYDELDAAFGGLDSAAQLTRSQLAINEIYARYGYRFHPEKSDTARYAYDYFNNLEWYTRIGSGRTWSNTGEVPVNGTEAANIELLVRWQKDHGLR